MAELVVKTPDGQLKAKVKDMKPWWYYDTVHIAAGNAIPEEIRFFQIPKGQNGKTDVDTNVLQYSTLPMGWEAIIYSIRIAVLSGILEDVQKILYNSVTSLEIQGTQEPFQAPTWIFGQGGGIFGAVAVATDGNANATTIEYQNWTNGMPTPQAVLRLPSPVKIKGGENFNVILKVRPGQTATNDIKVQCVLDCVAYQPVRGT